MENILLDDIINKKKWANTAETIKMISKAKESRGDAQQQGGKINCECFTTETS